MSHAVRNANRGLTPVVGIVLLVAITLLLAATVATFTLELGDANQMDRIPTVAMGYEYDSMAGGDDELRIVHRSGQAVSIDMVEIAVSGAECVGGSDDPNGRYDLADFSGMDPDDTLVAGESFEIDGSSPVECTAGGTLGLRSAVIHVSWVGSSGSSATLSSWRGPG